MMLWFPLIQLICSAACHVLSVWNQLVPELPQPENPVTLNSGVPGLLVVTSASNPGIPRLLPASLIPFE
jgi:hypothetical protein